jgi:hypothetical protein
MKTDIEILTDNYTEIILKLKLDVDFQKSLVAKLASRLEFHEERWRADVDKYEKQTVQPYDSLTNVPQLSKCYHNFIVIRKGNNPSFRCKYCNKHKSFIN